MNARGFTFIELIIGIVVISIGVIGVLAATRTAVVRSADPMIMHQAVAIAESYMEEILTKNFTGITPACTSRATFNSATCYDGLNQPPTNASGAALAGLGDYNVNIQVAATLGNCGMGLGDDESRIAITVTHPAGVTYRLDGCITNY